MNTIKSNTRTGFLAVTAMTLSLALAPATAHASAETAAPAQTAAESVGTSEPAQRAYFDKKYLLKTARYVISDMRTINSRLADGSSVSSAFYLLSSSYGYMLNAGVPPKIVKKARYRARLSTLSDFAELAGDEYYDDEISALARYSVIRKQTRIAFKQINTAIGSSLKVP